METLGVLRCEKLILDIDKKLVGIMQKIQMEEWERPTIFKEWRVKDIFSHLLDTSIRKLSMQRDGYFDNSLNMEITCYEDLIKFVTQLADQWAIATRRISPAILLKLFDMISEDFYQYFSSLDPYSNALFPVSWAGESVSKVWFDNAREYTEHWVHQQQIREALGVPCLYERKYLHPLNDTLIRALPYTYMDIDRPEGFSLNIEVTGDAAEKYCLIRQEKGWKLYRGQSECPRSLVRVEDQILWKILTKNIDKDHKHISIEGDEVVAGFILNATAMLI